VGVGIAACTHSRQAVRLVVSLHAMCTVDAFVLFCRLQSSRTRRRSCILSSSSFSAIARKKQENIYQTVFSDSILDELRLHTLGEDERGRKGTADFINRQFHQQQTETLHDNKCILRFDWRMMTLEADQTLGLFCVSNNT